jgi:hypothetical protein
LHAAAAITTATRFAAIEPILRVMLRLMILMILLMHVLMRSTATATTTTTTTTTTALILRRPRQCGACPVPNRNQQCRNMLAVLAGLLERRAGAVGSDAFAAESNRDGVRIGIGAAHFALRGRIVHVYVFDDFPLLVVEPTQKSAGSEKTAQTSVGECGKGVS